MQDTRVRFLLAAKFDLCCQRRKRCRDGLPAKIVFGDSLPLLLA